MDILLIIVFWGGMAIFFSWAILSAIKYNIEQKAIAPYKQQCDKLQKELDELKAKHKELSTFINNNSVENCKYLNKKLNTAYDDLKSCQFDLDAERRISADLRKKLSQANAGETDAATYKAEIARLEAKVSNLRQELQSYGSEARQTAELRRKYDELATIHQSTKIRADTASQLCVEYRDTLDEQAKTILKLEKENNKLSNLGFVPPVDNGMLPLISQGMFEQYMSQLSSERISRAITGQYLFEISAKVMSGKECYTTTLHSCTCKDHMVRKVICKHMMALALYVNAFIPYDSEVNKKVTSAANDLMYASTLLEEAEKIKRMAEKVNKAIDDKKQTFPLLADVLANFKEQRRNVTIKDNITKRDLTAMIKRVEKQNAMLQHQITVYEYMFPILNEFKDVPPQDLQSAVVEAGTTGFHYQWLSQEDFDALSDADKSQRLIDRYLNDRSKNAWEAGIKYERYIGYLCEQQGYSVKYTGALLKLNDMGRDLIVSKGKSIYIVQCKRYADNKEIHENHLFQLFGSVMHYSMEHPDKSVYGVFATSAAFSSVAAECAKKLDIKVYEHLKFEPYPAIKCNIGRSGEKIYHLPFDQQYDTVTVETRKGEMYVSTIKEAEDAGYRHAMRHSFTV